LLQAAKNRELYLVQLYHAEYVRDEAKKQLLKLRREVESAKAVKGEYEQSLGDKQRVMKELNREVHRLDAKIAKEVDSHVIFLAYITEGRNDHFRRGSSTKSALYV